MPLCTPVTCSLTEQAMLSNAVVKRLSALNYKVKWPTVYSLDSSLDPRGVKIRLVSRCILVSRLGVHVLVEVR